MIPAARESAASAKGLLESARRSVALLLIVVRSDARRPASWIALVAAAAAAVTLSGIADAMVVARAIVCGGLAAAAAVGSLAVADAALGTAAVWWVARCAWPVVGVVAGAVAVGGVAAVTMIAAALLTTLAHAVATRRGAAPAEATGVAIALAATAAGAATWAADAGIAAASAGASWLVLAIVAMAVSGVRYPDPLASAVSLTVRDRAVGGSTLTRLAMATTLAAMVICYFLVAERAAWYAAVAVGWFIALAVPAATIGPGAAGAANRGLLLRSAAGAPRLPGTLPHALGAIATHAAILGWPAGVAAVVRGPAAAEPWGPLVAVLMLATLAAATAVSVWMVSKCRATGDTSLALIAAWLIAVVMILSRAGGFS